MKYFNNLQRLVPGIAGRGLGLLGLTLLVSLAVMGCEQFEDPLKTGPDAPDVSHGVTGENPAQPQLDEPYEVDPPVNQGAVMEINEAGDLDPVLGDPAFEFQEPVE